ncbi:MAG: signal recognition particle protein [Nitrosopumilaceae archaeon]|nr:signal recognition particle protein [Nitrosopumilaceae archaeon]
MLDKLKIGLRQAIKNIVNSQGIDEELIKDLSRNIQRALLLADVNVKLVLEITKKLEKRSMEEKVPPGLSRKDHIVKIVFEELKQLLGDESKLQLTKNKTNVILVLGIQGSGKTTVTAKLSKLFHSQGYTVGVIGADTYRPGALDQLKTICSHIDTQVYGDENSKNPDQVVRKGLSHFSNSNFDVILIDTAGRHKHEQDLFDEMIKINEIAKPDFVLLVIDGTIGQQCFSQAQAFHNAIPIGGIIITKLDSTAKGGGAIAASAATGATVMYIGTGERINDIEEFSATRFVGRLLGMGDIQAILDLAKRLESESNDIRMKRISSGKMNIDDFYYQLNEVTKVGSIRNFLDNLPGFSGTIKDDQVNQMESRIEKWRHIIQSMTQTEKINPSIINSSRMKRIAKGSGNLEHDVKELLKNYKNSKHIMKASKGRQMKNTLRRIGLK